MGPRPLFRVFGIPVSVDLWFFIGLFFFYELSGGGRAGLYTAISVGVFVLIHELGHAVAARRFGAEVAIRLNFMVGWASYSAGTALTRWQRNVISLMGPLTQFVVGVATLWAVRHWVGVDRNGDLSFAVIWGGLVLAVLNLLPLWPLDGGHIVDSIIERHFGLLGRRAFLIFTLATSAAVLVFSLTQPSGGSSLERWAADRLIQALNAPIPRALGLVVIATPAIMATSAYFVALFCALSAFPALQTVDAARRGHPVGVAVRPVADEQTLTAVRSAERQGWSFNVPGPFPPGWVASPWLQAHLAATGGASREETSEQLLGLAAPTRNWMVDRLDRPEIGRLLELVPPLAASSRPVAEARVHHGSSEDLVSTALSAYHGDPTAEGFYLIAEGMAVRGDLDDAMSWLARAVQEHPDPRRVAHSRPLSALHGRSDFQQLLGIAERAVAPQRGP